MHDLIIIGAGPAGLAAALYAGRFRLNTLVVEKLSPGGQIILSPQIDNYPGFPGGIATSELIDRLVRQIEELGLRIESREAVELKVKPSGGNPVFSVNADGGSYEARAVIIATGAHPKQLGVQKENDFVGRGVSYCATCDAPLFRNKEVVVVGGGDRALEEALYLSNYASRVHLVHRRSAFRGARILEDKLRANPRIRLVLDSIVEGISGLQKVEKVLVKNVATAALEEITCEGVFIFVGMMPNTGFIKNMLHSDEQGFIITDQEMKTSQSGVFACGDCRAKSLYQVVTACSDGALAADSAHKYLMKL